MVDFSFLDIFRLSWISWCWFFSFFGQTRGNHLLKVLDLLWPLRFYGSELSCLVIVVLCCLCFNWCSRWFVWLYLRMIFATGYVYSYSPQLISSFVPPLLMDLISGLSFDIVAVRGDATRRLRYLPDLWEQACSSIPLPCGFFWFFVVH